MKRAGGWLLGLLTIASMGGGGWFALRRSLFAETVTVVLMRTGNSEPTLKALARGAASALEERGGRAGRFKVRLHEADPDTPLPEKTISWIGTSEAMMLKGDFQPTPLKVAAFDVHPWRSLDAYSMTPTLPRLGDLAAEWAKKSNASRIVLVRDRESLRSSAIADRFSAESRKLGLTLLADRSSTETDLADQILSTRPDLVFYSGEEAPYGTAKKIFGALRDKGFAGPLVMADADPEISFLATRPDLVEGCFLISLFAPAPAEVALRMGTTPGPHVTAGYFAMKAVLDTLELAPSSNEDDVTSAVVRIPYLRWGATEAPRPCGLYVARNGLFQCVEDLTWLRLPVSD